MIQQVLREKTEHNKNPLKMSFATFATLPLLSGVCGELFSSGDSLRHAVEIQIDCDTDNKRKLSFML